MIERMMTAGLRGGVGTLGRMMPNATARWFERQAMRPRPVPQLDLQPPTAYRSDSRVPFDGGSLAVSEWGAGPTVLLVHGWGGRSKSFWRMVDPLVDSGFRVVAFDLPAHGDSDGVRTNMPECARALDGLARTVGPLHAVVAHSFGSPTSALAATRGLEFLRWVMLGPPLSVGDLLRQTAGHIGVPSRVVDLMEASFVERLGYTWRELDTDRLVAELDVPLLVVHDESDRVMPWSHGAAIARAAPNGQLVTTAGLGHRAVLADEHVVQRVVAFVAEREVAAATA